MTPDALTAAIQTITANLAVPGQQRLFQQSETQTRYALINPLLQGLGWELVHPADVRPEFPIKKGKKADYALCVQGTPVVLGEAKRLHTKDLAPARDQGWDYCRASAVRYLFVTDGQRWEIYDAYQKQAPDAPPVARFDVARDPVETVVQRAQWLHKTRLQHERRPPLSIAEWNPPSKSRPEKVQFPDRSEVRVETWKALVVELTRWLVHAHHLTPARCPIWQTERSTKYAVHTKPVHSNDDAFAQPASIEGPAGALHVETKLGATQHARVIRNLITATGQDPAQFRVWFA